MAKDKSYRSGYKTTRADHPAENAAAQAAAMAMEASASIKAMIEKQQGPIPKLPPVYLDDAIRSRLLQWNIPQLIAMGASTGGTEALATVLTALRPPMPPIVVVQHIPPYFSRLFAQRLDADCELQISEAKEGDIPAANHVYIAPGERHMSLRTDGGRMRLVVQPGPRVNSVCPAVAVLFDSVARYVGGAALGILLTGMGRDGADGLLAMRRAGAHTLGQDEPSAVVYGMPKAAMDCGAVEQQLNLQDMAQAVQLIVHKTAC